MNTVTISEKLKSLNTLNDKASKFTLIVNEKSEVQGALFFVPVGGKEIKIIIPAPFHEELLQDKDALTYKKLLSHKEAGVLG